MSATNPGLRDGETDGHAVPNGAAANASPVVPNLVPPLKGGVGKETNLHPLSAADILARQPESIPWVWERYLPEGALALLAAFMKVGKSTFVYGLLVAIAQGRPFLGYPVKRCGVLVLAVEEHRRDVERRLRRLGMQPEDPIWVHAARLPAGKATFEEVRRFIRTRGIGLVILDTLSRFWTVTDENANAQIVAEVSPLLDLAHETGAAVLLVHHEGKRGGEDGRGIRGGSALFALVDQALILERRKGGNKTQRVLTGLGRYEETPRSVVIEYRDNEYVLVGSTDDMSREAIKVQVSEALSADAQDVPALAIRTGLNGKAVRQALAELGDSVIRDGKGVKGDPVTYRRRLQDSIPSQADPLGEEPNPGAERGTARIPIKGMTGSAYLPLTGSDLEDVLNSAIEAPA